MEPSRETSETITDQAGTPKPFAPPWFFVSMMLAISLGTGTAALRAFNRYETTVGHLQAKSRGVYSIREARVATVLVNPGDIVEPGAPLVKLHDLNLERRIRAAEKRLAVHGATLDERKARAEVELHNRKQSIESEIFQVKLQKLGLEKTSRTDIDHQLTGVGRVRPISDGQSTPEINSTAESIEFLPQIRVCDDRLARLDEELAQLPETIQVACGVKTAEAQRDLAETELKDLQQQETMLTLSADVHGTVGILNAQTGDIIPARHRILSLMDEDQPYLVVRIPSERLGDYSPNTELRILFPGGLERAGRVERVPPQADHSLASQTDSERTQVEIVVVPVGAQWPTIPFGATVEVRRDR